MRTIRSIVAATDFSLDAEEAIRHAVELAGALGAQLTLLHVFQPPTYPPDAGSLMIGAQLLPPIYESAREALAQAAALAETALGRPVSTQLVDGAPAKSILRVARELDAGLIVLGTHGRTGLKHLLMGSVAESVVRHADRPVFTTHAPAAEHAIQ